MTRGKNDIIVHPRYRHMLAERPAQGQRPVRISDLPPDLLQVIAKKLRSPKDLCRYQQICKATKLASVDDNLWKRLCQQDFGTPQDFVAAKQLTWREAYRLQRHILYNVIMAGSTATAGFNVGGLPIMIGVR